MKAAAVAQWRQHATVLKAIASRGEYGTPRHVQAVRRVTHYAGQVAAFNEVLQLPVDSGSNSG